MLCEDYDIKKFIQKEIEIREKILSSYLRIRQIEDIATLIKERIVEDNNTIAFCGNGGSATLSSHLIAEIVNRYTKKTHIGLSSISFYDSAVLTAISNDYDFVDVFSIQVEAKLKKDDILVGFSTSGNSKNVIKAIEVANNRGITTIAIVGKEGSLNDSQIADYTLEVPSQETAIVQSIHLMIGHIICGKIEEKILSITGSSDRE
jgi:D-sedoheptulose 7-phosphate isomerase